MVAFAVNHQQLQTTTQPYYDTSRENAVRTLKNWLVLVVSVTACKGHGLIFGSGGGKEQSDLRDCTNFLQTSIHNLYVIPQTVAELQC